MHGCAGHAAPVTDGSSRWIGAGDMTVQASRNNRSLTAGVLAALGIAAGQMAALSVAAGAAPRLPEIRITDANKVPACVTPERMNAFIKSRNPRLDVRYKDLAQVYKHYGEGWRVRWDYAIFQMAVETNFLSYRRPDGRMGDVDPKQNNFAGIGTTGGGVPGDSYADIKTGVLAHIQHLVAYSGERLADPVASRTRLKQNDIIEASLQLNRPVLFSDLARRWAVDKAYGSSIEWVARSYRDVFCGNGMTPPQVAIETPRVSPVAARPAAVKPAAEAPAKMQRVAAQPAATVLKSEPQPASPVRTVWSRDKASPQARPDAGPAQTATVSKPASTWSPPAASVAQVAPLHDLSKSPPAGLGMSPPRTCAIQSASYGGRKTFLIRAEDQGVVQFTALTVLDGFEKSMTQSFLNARAPGGVTVGEFPDQDTALARAREFCPPS